MNTLGKLNTEEMQRKIGIWNRLIGTGEFCLVEYLEHTSLIVYGPNFIVAMLLMILGKLFNF